MPQTKKNEARQQSRAEDVDNQKSPEIDHETEDAGETSRARCANQAALIFTIPGAPNDWSSHRSADGNEQPEHARKGGEPEEDIHDDRPSGADEHGALAADSIGQKAVDDLAAA